MMDELKKPAPLRKISKRNHGKKKLKTLRRSVLDPILIAITVINLVMILFFNIVILLMLYSNVVSDLNSISGTMEQLVAAQENDDWDEYKINHLYEEEVERRIISYQISIITANQEGKIHSSDSLKKEQKSIIEAELKKDAVKNSTGIFRVTGNKDIILLKKVNIESENGNAYYISASLFSLLSTVKSSNQALLVIVALSVLCFILAAFIIAHNISKPIKKLSDHMEVIGDGDFTPIEIKETTKELHTLVVSINEMLTRLDAYKLEHNRSIQNLSHDLKTPLMSISGYAEAIKYGVMDKDEATDVIIKESQRLTEVVEKMLILSELDALSQPVNMEQLNLSEFINEETKRIEGYAMQTEKDIECVCLAKNGTVLADRKLLSTVVRNLLSNAIRYAQNQVKVCICEGENSHIIYVADDGKGLSNEDMKYLFVRYYVGQTGHTGLGLSIAKSAAEYMGCTLMGENRHTLPPEHPCYSEHGAVFTVSIPEKQ